MARIKRIAEEAVRLGAKRQVTIPRRICKALRLSKGDYVFIRLVGKRLEMVPIRKDQLWFWTPEWQEKEREADEDLTRGEVQAFDSVDQLMKDLKSDGPLTPQNRQSTLSRCGARHGD